MTITSASTLAATTMLSAMAALSLFTPQPVHVLARTSHPTKSGAVPTESRVSYARDVAPILYEHCDNCHRAGQISPFALTSYGDAKKHSRQIAEVTRIRLMPPWKAENGYGHFTGERRLSSQQISTLQRWADSGAPQGRVADIPALPKFPSGWSLGTPDTVVQPTESYSVIAEGNDIYRCFVIPTSYTEDRWLSGMEVHPGNRKIVHHIIAYLDTSGKARKLDAADPGPGYTSFGGPGFSPSGSLGGWVPGTDPARLPNGVGMLLPKGADIVLQVHYHKDGKPESDLTKIGLFFAKTPVDKRYRNLMIINQGITIPAGIPNYAAKASYKVPMDVTVYDVMPHMHLIGHDMTVLAKVPATKDIPLVKVTDWDFNWQTKYVYQEPIKIPAGSEIDLTAHYNNTSSNPRNPNSPARTVTWGEQTTDEMCIAFLGYTVDAEHLTKGISIDTGPEFGRAQRESQIKQFVAKFDRDGDGKLNVAELTNLIQYYKDNPPRGRTISALKNADPSVTAARLMALFDRKGDGKLDGEELVALIKLTRSRQAN